MQTNKKRTDRRIVRSKEALKQSLLSLLSQKSFSSISITEIVESANYNRGTFYTHYDNKEALLDDILTPLMEELIASFRAPYGDVDVFHIDELPGSKYSIISIKMPTSTRPCSKAMCCRWSGIKCSPP
ncbi:TetR/AcrR family transcriptional regulator [Paenibacillus lautus]|uniref:TetR/AcrR family transcriptional regulator n=1 Tax=Paenibacillus lautus TaxID=1401 RepID=UPI00384FBCC1